MDFFERNRLEKYNIFSKKLNNKNPTLFNIDHFICKNDKFYEIYFSLNKNIYCIKKYIDIFENQYFKKNKLKFKNLEELICLEVSKDFLYSPLNLKNFNAKLEFDFLEPEFKDIYNNFDQIILDTEQIRLIKILNKK